MFASTDERICVETKSHVAQGKLSARKVRSCTVNYWVPYKLFPSPAGLVDCGEGEKKLSLFERLSGKKTWEQMVWQHVFGRSMEEDFANAGMTLSIGHCEVCGIWSGCRLTIDADDVSSWAQQDALISKAVDYLESRLYTVRFYVEQSNRKQA